MSTNIVFDKADVISITFAADASAGDPVAIGQVTGVAVNDVDVSVNAVGLLQVRGIANLSVKAIDKDGNSAVAIGDAIYYVAGQTPVLSKVVTAGVLFGYALEAITSGSTATIQVLMK